MCHVNTTLSIYQAVYPNIRQLHSNVSSRTGTPPPHPHPVASIVAGIFHVLPHRTPCAPPRRYKNPLLPVSLVAATNSPRQLASLGFPLETARSKKKKKNRNTFSKGKKKKKMQEDRQSRTTNMQHFTPRTNTNTCKW